jgi:RHS repeat-associated protein
MTFRIRDAQAAALRIEAISRGLAERLKRNGFTTKYDGQARALVATDAAQRATRYEFGGNGHVERVVTPAGRAIRLRHDADGRLNGVLEPSGRLTELKYDSSGVPTSFSRDQRELCTLLDSENHDRIEAHFGDGSSALALFNASGQPVELTDRVGAADHFDYDENGRLIELIDGEGRKTTFAYVDSGGTERVSSTAGVKSYELDTTRRLPLVMVDRGAVARVDYDAHGLPAKLRYSDGNEYAFVRDDSGRLVAALGPNSQSTYTYDESGRLASEDNDGQTFRFSYDVTGLVSTLEYPDGANVSFAYDADKRVARITDWAGGGTSFEYDLHDKLRSSRLPNGLETTEELAPGGRPSHVKVANQRNGTPLYESVSTFDAQDRLISCTDSEFGLRDYHYDAESQLLQVRRGDGAALEWFGYDRAGNRTHCTGHVARAEPGNRLVLNGPVAADYDERGNLRSLIGSGAHRTFKYDLRNQLIEATGPDGTTLFQYDALGRRISKLGPKRSIRYVWCGEQLARELVQSDAGVEVRSYLYLPGTHVPFALSIDGRCYYFHNDQLGTPQRLTDSSGHVVWSAWHESFGMAHITRATIENPLRFPGQYFDEETGLCFNRSRYYSPELGRYVSEDPIGLLGGHNLYLYCGNDPINRSDPRGFWWKAAVSVLVGVAAAAGTVALVTLTAPVSVPILVGAAVLGLGVALGTDKALNIDHFCVPCLAKAFGTGLLEGVTIGLLAAELPVDAVGLGVVGAYAMLAEHFGWPFPGSDGVPFDKRTNDQKNDSLGGLVGNLVGGILSGFGTKAPSEEGEGKVFRQDDRPNSPDGRNPGTRKSHINEDGDIEPADPNGRTTPQEHVLGVEPEKSSSPYTSFKEKPGTGKAYGDPSNKPIEVDVARLKEDIASGKVKDVEVIDNDQLMKVHDDNVNAARQAYDADPTPDTEKSLNEAQNARDLSARDSEVLIKGTIPSDYVTPSGARDGATFVPPPTNSSKKEDQ